MPTSIKLGPHKIHQVNGVYFKRCHQISFLLGHEIDPALFQQVMHIMMSPDRLIAAAPDELSITAREG